MLELEDTIERVQSALHPKRASRATEWTLRTPSWTITDAISPRVRNVILFVFRTSWGLGTRHYSSREKKKRFRAGRGSGEMMDSDGLVQQQIIGVADASFHRVQLVVLEGLKRKCSSMYRKAL